MKELSDQELLDAYFLAKKIGLDEEFIHLLAKECLVRGLNVIHPMKNEP